MTDPVNDLVEAPLVVEGGEDDGLFYVLSGNHRLAALQRKKYDGGVPCVLRKKVKDDVERIRIALGKRR
jgi:hypothetical protein